MNCRDSKALLLAERDGVLTPTQHADLQGHVATCPQCQQFRAALAESAVLIAQDAATFKTPQLEAEWRAVRAQLHEPTRASSRSPKQSPLAQFFWFGAPLAAAAAVLLAFFSPVQGNATVAPAQAIFVEAADTHASTLVYVDNDSGWLVVWASSDEPAQPAK